ncbi:uncharacterized protein N7515_002016 [Penicillium bovifimosum]|uniref:Uncharacterized protein n=1 Tax=Penicillium bovifimosum TaxID=126998 RepID=A0A9W9HAU3_9EURO|nr:uncharacterized protein N7515_002016 [Penicillium bovifimosum]KAJ5143229.1 hypothetical protein N7515_002016 [Penicillium bovifimosum]
MVPYRRGCWQPNPPESGHDNQTQAALGFHHERLDRIRVKIPFASVNQEARKIGLKWAERKGFEIRHDADNNQVCHRPFDPKRDVIWIGNKEAINFNVETWTAINTNHPRGIPFIPAGINRFAIPEAMWHECMSFTLFRDTVCCLFRDTTFYVVTNRLPLFDEKNSGSIDTIQPRWELKGIHGAHSFNCDSQDGRSEIQNGDKVSVGPFRYQVARTIAMIADLHDTNTDGRVMRFELRPVHAVRT